MKPARSLADYEAAMRAPSPPAAHCGHPVRTAPQPPAAVHVESINPLAALTSPLPGKRPGKLSAVGWLGVLSGLACAPLALFMWQAFVPVLLGVACWFWARNPPAA